MMRILTNDKVITVETTVTESDRHVSYDDIVDAVTVEYDDWHNEAPWDACDGWEHDYRRFSWCDVDGVMESRGYGYSDANRESFVIEISDEQLEKWGNYDYFRANGCSKQVAAELVAQVKRNALDQLVKWYSDGWHWYYVGGEYEDYSAGVGGVDDEDYAEELRYEIADEIADQMENDGYIVEGRHNPYNQTKAENYALRRKLREESFIIR